METIYFLVFVGVCVFAILWAARHTKSEKELAKRNIAEGVRSAEKLLSTSADPRLSHKEELWEARRKTARKGFSKNKPFVPKFEQERAAQYDGYSRRDRHHLTATEHIKKEGHIDRVDEFEVNSAEYKAGEHAPQP